MSTPFNSTIRLLSVHTIIIKRKYNKSKYWPSLNSAPLYLLLLHSFYSFRWIFLLNTRHSITFDFSFVARRGLFNSFKNHFTNFDFYVKKSRKHRACMYRFWHLAWCGWWFNDNSIMAKYFKCIFCTSSDYMLLLLRFINFSLLLYFTLLFHLVAVLRDK